MAIRDQDRPDPSDLAAIGMTEAEFAASYEAATAKGQAVLSDETRIVAARYDRLTGRVVIDLANRMTLMIPTDTLQALAGAAPEDLEQVELLGTHTLDWPRLDQQVDIPDLLLGITGTRQWMAAQLGRAGGKARSAAKTAAVRANGRKGGRPKKQASS